MCDNGILFAGVVYDCLQTVIALCIAHTAQHTPHRAEDSGKDGEWLMCVRGRICVMPGNRQ